MFLNKILLKEYGIDKLHVRYTNYSCLIDCIYKNVLYEGYAFKKIRSNLIYSLFEVWYNDLLIGVLSFKSKNQVILQVDNCLLYSNECDIIYHFQHTYDLRFDGLEKIEIYCDSNVDLPRKMNRVLHDRRYVIQRYGRPMYNRNGNIYLGYKVTPNFVQITENKEKRGITYSFTPLVTSGCKDSEVELFGYNKSIEVNKVSHKYYILASHPFGDDVVHRLEVRTCGYEMTQCGINVEEFYGNFKNRGYVEWLFLKYLNRFFELREGNKVHKLSDVLRLTKPNVQGRYNDI